MAKVDNSNYMPLIDDNVYRVKMQRLNGSEMEDFEIRIRASDNGFQISVSGEGLGTVADFDEDLELVKVDDEDGYLETA